LYALYDFILSIWIRIILKKTKGHVQLIMNTANYKWFDCFTVLSVMSPSLFPPRFIPRCHPDTKFQCHIYRGLKIK